MRFFLLAAALTFCNVMTSAAEAPKEQKPFKEPATGLVFPVKLGDWNKIEDFNLGGGAGVCVSYKRDIATARIFVYNMDLKYIPHDLSSAVLKDNFTSSKNDIVGKSAERGGTAEKTKEDQVATGKDEDARKFLRAVFEMKEKTGRELISQLLLSDYKNQFFKIRATYQKKDKDDGEKAVDALMSEIGKLIKN